MFLTFFALAAHHVNSEPDTPYWKDINAVTINKEEPRSSFFSYDDISQALTYDFTNSPYCINLNG